MGSCPSFIETFLFSSCICDEFNDLFKRDDVIVSRGMRYQGLTKKLLNEKPTELLLCKVKSARIWRT